MTSPAAQMIQEALFLRRMTQAELAWLTGLSAKHINQVVRGWAPITPEVALKIEDATTLPAEELVALDARYRVRVARQGRRT